MRKEPSGVTRPEDWPALFSERLRAGDIDALAALYDRDARFVQPSGEALAGRDQVRAVLAGLVEAKARMEHEVVQVVCVDDIAMLYTNFKGESVDASGQATRIDQKAIEVLRRQADGSWTLIMGDPWGRGR